MSNPVFPRNNETHVPIPVDLHNQLRAIATRHETPVNDLIAAFLRQAVEQTAERQRSGKRNRIPDSAFAV